MHTPSVGKVMTQFPHSIDVGEDVVAARVLMDEHEIRHLPVTQGGKIVGVITDRDIQVAGALSGSDAGSATVREVCHMPAYVVAHDTPLDSVLENLIERHITSAVVTENDSLAGVFTLTDVCRLLLQRFR
jgi:acetoin utilization protein AcuB